MDGINLILEYKGHGNLRACIRKHAYTFIIFAMVPFIIFVVSIILP